MSFSFAAVRELFIGSKTEIGREEILEKIGWAGTATVVLVNQSFQSNSFHPRWQKVLTVTHPSTRPQQLLAYDGSDTIVTFSRWTHVVVLKYCIFRYDSCRLSIQANQNGATHDGLYIPQHDSIGP